MRKSKNHQINSIVQCHHKTRHIWIGNDEFQFRIGAGGFRLIEQNVGSKLEVAAGMVYISDNVYAPIWLSAYNYTPIAYQISFTSQYLGNIASTKFAYQIDPLTQNGDICVTMPAMDANLNETDSWIVLPPSTFTYNGRNVALPIGWKITIINELTGYNNNNQSFQKSYYMSQGKNMIK